MLPTPGGPLMSLLPGAARPLLHAFAGAFTPPTCKRFITLMLGAVLTTGRRTITNLLRAVGGLAPGHPSSSHRVFSRRRWSLWTLGHALADFILRRWVPQGSVPLVGDDTVDEHRGAKVYGKGKRTVKPVLPRLLSCWVGPFPPTQEPAHGTPQRPQARTRLAATVPLRREPERARY